ncbi:hypothetical protein LJR153_007266 [Paenibacillus sp. LjRoot153]|uniref:hypothetical protein n=1 Tax=Paenibacillus sp. LjRoot153 TaxID=3342270 RepID=UPI003ECCC2F4
MTQTYDDRIANLALTGKIVEEIDLGLADCNRTLQDIRDADFKKIITAAKFSPSLAAAILAGGFTSRAAATAMGASLASFGLATGATGLLGLIGLPLLPIAIIGILYKKKKEKEKREKMERDLLHAEKLALQKIIKKQVEVIQELKKAMEDLNRMHTETASNAAKTKEYANKLEDRVEYLERLIKMVNMAGEAFGVGAA